MADIQREVAGIFNKLFRDMGDGTHAEVVAIGESELPTGAATAIRQDTGNSLLNSLLAALMARLPAALGAGGGVKIDGSGVALPVSGSLAISSEPSGSGVITTSTHFAPFGVTSASQVILAANGNRIYALFVNDSDYKIYISEGVAAVVGQGIPISPGGSYEMSLKFANLYRGAIYAIHGSTGTKNLLVTEGV